MEFSSSFSCSNGMCEWSPDGRFLALLHARRLVLRCAKTLQVVSSFVAEDTVDKIVFSPDSEFILVSLFGIAVSYVLPTQSGSDWQGKITEGPAGLIDIVFAPDSRHILSTAEFSVKTTIWSLISKSVSYVKFPKSPNCIQFSGDGKYLAVVERRENKDCISIFNTSSQEPSWSLVKHYETDCVDCAGLSWSPTDNVLAVWDNPLEYRILFYSVDGRCICSYTAYTQALGIKSVQWDPSGKIIAIGSFDDKIRLLNTFTWSLITELDHAPHISRKDPVTKATSIFEEVEVPIEDIDTKVALELAGPNGRMDTTFAPINASPVNLVTAKTDPKKSIRLGIGEIRFSNDGRYVASRCDKMPYALWVWDLKHIVLAAVVIHKDPVVNFSWEPNTATLMSVTGNNGVAIWTPVGVVAIKMPANEQDVMVQNLKWNPRGKAVGLIGRESVVCCKLGRGMRSEDEQQDD